MSSHGFETHMQWVTSLKAKLCSHVEHLVVVWLPTATVSAGGSAHGCNLPEHGHTNDLLTQKMFFQGWVMLCPYFGGISASEKKEPPPSFIPRREPPGSTPVRPHLEQVGGSQKAQRPGTGGFQKGGFWRMLPGTKSRNEGTFGCSPVPKTGRRVYADIPRYQKPERGRIRQNRPFTKLPPFYETALLLPLEQGVKYRYRNVHQAFQGSTAHQVTFVVPFSLIPCKLHPKLAMTKPVK